MCSVVHLPSYHPEIKQIRKDKIWVTFYCDHIGMLTCMLHPSGRPSLLICWSGGSQPALISGLAAGSRSKNSGFSWLCFTGPEAEPLDTASDLRNTS